VDICFRVTLYPLAISIQFGTWGRKNDGETERSIEDENPSRMGGYEREKKSLKRVKGN